VNSGAAFGVALAVGLLATPLAALIARRLGVVDRPGPLKVQQTPVPYLGGLAVLVALAAPVAIERPSLLAPLGLAALLGLTDDLAEISARFRLLAEVALGLLAGIIVAAPPGGLLGLVVTAVLVVGLVNAVNLIDGLDGLAGGVACASAAGFALLGGPGGPIAAAGAGALGAFLVYNRPPARIYLGDSGSYLVGALLAIAAAMAMDDPGGASGWASIPLLIALPVLDTAVAILRRRRARRPLFQGDRSHIYDQLVDRGRTRVQSVVAMIVLQIILTATGLFTANLAASVALPAAAVVIGVLALVILIGGFLDPDARTHLGAAHPERSSP
jgi:UDP-GlcNAc:undecaprenyl-phosphate GlcNAc-1-phosphate transferase